MVLAASREPLQLQGLPVPESADLATLEASSAARLFLQRARQAGGGTRFAMTSGGRAPDLPARGWAAPGLVSWGLNQQSDARRFLEDSVRLWREIGDQESLAQTLNHLGELLRGQGDYAGAQHCFLEALRVAQAA